MPGLICLRTWDEAIARFTSEEWQDERLDVRNALTLGIATVSQERLNRWNELHAELMPIVHELVERKTAAVIAEYQLPAEFFIGVNWDIYHSVLEREYLDIVQPGLYKVIADVYLLGRLPCGYDEARKSVVIF